MFKRMPTQATQASAGHNATIAITFASFTTDRVQGFNMKNSRRLSRDLLHTYRQAKQRLLVDIDTLEPMFRKWTVDEWWPHSIHGLQAVQ